MKGTKEKKMKKSTALVLTLLLILASFTSCGNKQETTDDSTITFALTYEMETMDIANYSGDSSLMVLRLCSEPLLRNVNGQAEYGLAESYDVSEDGKTYTFHLRNANFADGTPITANDIYYSVMRTLKPETAGEAAYNLYDIVGAEVYNMGGGTADSVGVAVLDEKTIQITTEEVTYPLFFTDLGFVPLEQSVVEAAGDAYGSEAEYICCSGPYILTEWTHESEVVLERNPDYWNADAIKTEKLVGKINVSGQTGYDMLVAGELDICDIYDDMDIVNQLLDTGDFADYIFEGGCQLLNVNQKGRTEETGKWLSNANFRKALSYAIDRESLVKAVLTCSEPATRLSAPSLPGVSGNFNEEYPYEGWSAKADSEQAQAYLSAAMKELGVSSVDAIPEFSLLCNDSQNNMSFMNAVSDMWKQTLGVRSKVDAQPLNTMLDKMNNTGNFDFVKGGKSYGLIDWTGEIASFYLSTAGNPNNNNSKEFDSLYYNTVHSKNWQERKDNIFAMEEYFCDNALSLVITWTAHHNVYRNGITGFKTTSDGYCDYTYLERS